MKVDVKATRYFSCPNGCDHDLIVEPLLASAARDQRDVRAGAWFCDECGGSWTPTASPNGTIDVEPGVRRHRKVIVTLTLPPQSKPITLDVVTFADVDDTMAEVADQKRYLYNEHTCPTNWLGDVSEIQCDGDGDPHGLFRFTSVVEAVRDDGGQWAKPS